MSMAFRALLVGDRSESHALLTRLLEGSDIGIDALVPYDQVPASVATRAPDVIIVLLDGDIAPLSDTCRSLKQNPATVLLPLIAITVFLRTRKFAGSQDQHPADEKR